MLFRIPFSMISHKHLWVAQLIDIRINEHFVQIPNKVNVGGVFLVVIFHRSTFGVSQL
jgi:hypothetical protein